MGNKKASKKLLSLLLCIALLPTIGIAGMIPASAAGGLPAVSASPAVPVAQPWHNQSFAGDPAGFRPDQVPTAVTLDNQGANATITYTKAEFAVANGAAPTQQQIDSVPTPDRMSTAYTAPISVDITDTKAVVIKAYAYTAGAGADDSAVTTWVGFQRVWVLTDVKTLKDGTPNDYRAKVPTAWTDFILDKVIAEMTDTERYPMLGGGQNWQLYNGVPNPIGNPTNFTVSGLGTLYGYSDVRLNSSATGVDFGISRLCIPTTIMSDGPAGVRNGKNATAWVVATALASSWDTDVQRMFAEGVANDAKWFGYDFILAPAFDIHRSPIGGRNFEYYSEDPIISGKNAVTYTQTLGEQKEGVSLKHYVANDQENNRNNLNAIISERTLREINLLPFEMAVMQADPYAIMTSYNPMNGPHTTLNPWLQDSLPYDQWGYQGFFQTDWGNTWNAAAVIARCDQHQPTASLSVIQPFLTYENGASGAAITPATYTARRAIVDRDIKDILRSVIKMPDFAGDFDGLSSTTTAARHTSYYTDTNSPQIANAALNRELAAKSMILLRNNEVNGVPALPLVGNAKKSISLVYDANVPNSVQGNVDYVLQGGGSGAVTWNRDTHATIRNGLLAAGYTVPNYILDSTLNSTANAPNLDATMANYAADTDVGIQIISRTSSEGSDVTAANFNLNANEKAVIAAMSAAFHAAGKPFIVLINMGGNINTTEIRASADAILHISDAGQEGGLAVADVLSGAINPSGKTVDTWPLTYDDTVPMLAYNYFKDQTDPSHEGYTWASTSSIAIAFYDEGNLPGYRFFETIAALDPTFKVSDHVAFPFGFGLSYTTFSYSDLKLSSDVFNMGDNDATVTATVTVTNTGSVDGRTAVELYLGASTFAEEGRPVRELKDYAMSKVLAAGESQDISFTINKRDLCYFYDGKDPNWVRSVSRTSPTSNPIYAAYNNVAPAATDLTLGYVKTSLNGVEAYTTYNGFYGEDGYTTGWRVDSGTTFTVQIGDSSNTADLAARGVEATFNYGAYAGISAPAVVNTDKEQFIYNIGVGQTTAATMIDIKVQFDSSKLDSVGSTVLPAVEGWSILRENYDPDTGLYIVTLSAMGGTPLSTEGLKDILSVTFNANPGVKLNDVIAASLLSVDIYEKASVTNIKLSALLDPDTASTKVTNHLRWDVSDGNNGGPDGFLRLEDLAYIIDSYYGARADDPNWDEAENFDANGDGVINIDDILIILSYIS